MSVRDDNQQELISGLLDGTLGDSEREQAERLLRENDDMRQLHQELKSVRSMMQRVATDDRPPALGSDFANRIVAAAQARRAAEAGQDYGAEPATTTQDNSAPVDRSLLIVVAILLLGLTIGLVANGLRSNDVADKPSNPDNGNSELVETPGPEITTVGETVYVSTNPVMEFCLVMDVTLTKAGQQNKVFENALNRIGVRFDHSVKLTKELESNLLQSRFIGKKVAAGEQAAGKKPEGKQKVELVFVTARARHINDLWTTLASAPQEVENIRFDLTLKAADPVMFEQLDEEAGVFVKGDTQAPPNQVAMRIGRAQRLITNAALFTQSVFENKLQPQLNPLKVEQPKQAPAQPAPQAQPLQAGAGENEPCRVLFLLRK